MLSQHALSLRLTLVRLLLLLLYAHLFFKLYQPGKVRRCDADHVWGPGVVLLAEQGTSLTVATVLQNDPRCEG